MDCPARVSRTSCCRVVGGSKRVGVAPEFYVAAMFVALTAGVMSVFFALIHYNYYIQDGTFFPGALIGPLLFGLAFGWLRWRSGRSRNPRT